MAVGDAKSKSKLNMKVPSTPAPVVEDNEDLLFRACDRNGKPYEFRISAPSKGRELHEFMRGEDSEETARRGKIQRMYDGFLPFDPRKMEQSGCKNGANINFHGLRGIISYRVAPILGLAIDTIPLVELHSKTPAEDGPDMTKVIDIICDEYSAVLRDSNRFLPCLAHMFEQADLFGLGPVTWESDRDYVPLALRRGQLTFPSNTSSISTEADLLMVEMVLPASFLFGLFDRAKAAEVEGWDMAALKKLLVAVFVDNKQTESETGGAEGVSSVEASILRWRENRSQDVDQFKTVSVVVEYVKELGEGRGISKSIRSAAAITSDNEIPTLDPSAEKYLFRKNNAFKTMDECILWMPSTITEFTARGLRGIASLMFPIEDRSNKFLCQVIDSAGFAMSFPMQGRTPNARDVSVTQVGPLAIIGQDLTPVQHTKTMSDFQTLVGVRELFNNVASNNSLGLRGPTASPERVYAGADRKTRDQVSMEAEAAGRVDAAVFAIRVQRLDRIFAESWKRFSKLVFSSQAANVEYPQVEEFIERCEGRGVPKPVLTEYMKKLHALTNRDLAYGDGNTKAGVLSELLGNFGGDFDEQGRISAVRDILRAKLGPRASEKYRPEVDRSQLPSDSVSLAVLENNAMMIGGQVVVGADQLHWSHIPVHSQIIQQVSEQFQAGETEDPNEALRLLEVSTEHIRGHLEYGRMQTGMEGAAKQIEANIRSLSPIIKGLQMAAATIDKQREAEQRKQQREMESLQQKADENELAPKMAEVEQKGKLAMREQDLLHEARMAGVQNEAQIAAAKNSTQAALQEANQKLAEEQSYADSRNKERESVAKTSKMLERVEQGGRITRGTGPQTNVAGVNQAEALPGGINSEDITG